MTRQKKTHLAILAIVPALVFAAARCADPNATAPTTVERSSLVPDRAAAAKLAKLQQETDWIGKFHNDALAYVLADLQRLPPKARERSGVCEAARKSYREFHRSRRGSDVPASVEDAFGRFCAGGGRTIATSIARGAGDPRRQSDVSFEAQGFMDQFLGAIDASVSYDDLRARVNSIEAAAVATLGPDEASAVVGVGSIALSSADYWANNLPAWEPFVGPDAGFFMELSAARSGSLPFAPGITGSYYWRDFASRVWNDAKAAAKRAAIGDVSAAERSVVAMGVGAILGGPASWEALVAASATGSIMAVL